VLLVPVKVQQGPLLKRAVVGDSRAALRCAHARCASQVAGFKAQVHAGSTDPSRSAVRASARACCLLSNCTGFAEPGGRLTKRGHEMHETC